MNWFGRIKWENAWKCSNRKGILNALYANRISRCFKCPGVNAQWLTAHARTTFNCSRTRSNRVKSTCLRYMNLLQPLIWSFGRSMDICCTESVCSDIGEQHVLFKREKKYFLTLNILKVCGSTKAIYLHRND